MSKIKMSDSSTEIFYKLSEGNPGCLMFLGDLTKKKGIEAIGYFLKFDSMELYGSRLYMLWNDCCNRDTEKVIAVIDKLHTNELTEQDILDHVEGDGYRGTPFDM